MYQLLETIVLTHNPTWGDPQAIINTFFTMEEKRLVLEKSREENEHCNADDDPARHMPKTDPEWDPNRGTERNMLK